MAILKAYFDDSKDNRVLTIAGYLSDHESWARFDHAWQVVLDRFHVPYLHMSEFWDRDGIYRHIKDDPKEEEAFFAGIVKVICDHLRFCVQTTVVLDDVKKFNRVQKYKLSAQALAIYGCLLRLQTQFNGQPIEVIFDKFERASSFIELGKHYAEADAQQPLNKHLILSVRVEDGESWRTILPLQAADFVAWEMRKYCNDPLPWIEQLKYDDISSGAALRNFQEWFTRFVKEEERLPRYRKSFDALKKCRASPDGFLFNYAALELLQYRHPYGWRLSEKRRMALFSEDQDA
jgi:hypothetical protein